MHLGRLGVALGITASIAGAAWAGIPGGEGMLQIGGRPYGQQPVQPQEVGLRAAPAGPVTRYDANAPQFEIGLPSEWRIYRSPAAAPSGALKFLAAPDRTGRVTQRVWADGTPRADAPKPALNTPGAKVPVLVATIGQRVADRDLQELRAFASRQAAIMADGREIDLYAYHTRGSAPHSDQNVAVATTTSRDAAPGRGDLELVYFAAHGGGG